jgi:hypothetical protein
MNKQVLFIVASLWGNTVFSQEHGADVEDLKIAFVYNFSKYVSWPASALAAADDVTFCVAGSRVLIDKFNILDGQLTNQKTIRVVSIQQPGFAMQDCHVLYVAADYETDSSQLLSAFGDRPLLTVGDGRDFTEQGGMIELMEVDNKITFRINNTQAQAQDIAISSMLLRLAK